MKVTVERIEAWRLLPSQDLHKLGIGPDRVLRVTLETVDDDDEIAITEMNAKGGAFDHLAEEPDIYSDSDLVERNEDFLR